MFFSKTFLLGFILLKVAFLVFITGNYSDPPPFSTFCESPSSLVSLNKKGTENIRQNPHIISFRKFRNALFNPSRFPSSQDLCQLFSNPSFFICALFPSPRFSDKLQITKHYYQFPSPTHTHTGCG